MGVRARAETSKDGEEDIKETSRDGVKLHDRHLNTEALADFKGINLFLMCRT